MVRCSKCRRMLAETQFPPSALGYCCLACFREINRAYRKNNTERVRRFARERIRRWRETHTPIKRVESATTKAKAKERARKLYKEHPQRVLARLAVQRAVKSGRLVRQPCEKCGAEKTQAHHDDYSKPLDVRWLCARDHVREHKWIA